MDLVLKKPEWLTIRLNNNDKFSEVKDTLKELKLVTVCEESHCPNIPECWSGGTATFMVMGDTCTRACKFCNVKTGFPARELDPTEPYRLAEAISKWKLDYIVITSVDRDDLKDQGSSHFAQCIGVVKQKNPGVIVEVLIPDFRGNKDFISNIINARPDVIAHNIETVRSLQKKVRDPRANYEQSLSVLKYVKEINPDIYTKSSLMLGLGEAEEEVLQAMKDLRAINVDIITFGQYLRPSSWHLPVLGYVHPDRFEYFKQKALEFGFLYCASGPFVRSSYKAGELFMKALIKKRHYPELIGESSNKKSYYEFQKTTDISPINQE